MWNRYIAATASFSSLVQVNEIEYKSKKEMCYTLQIFIVAGQPCAIDIHPGCYWCAALDRARRRPTNCFRAMASFPPSIQSIRQWSLRKRICRRKPRQQAADPRPTAQEAAGQPCEGGERHRHWAKEQQAHGVGSREFNAFLHAPARDAVQAPL
jgi:hypothetical protein